MMGRRWQEWRHPRDDRGRFARVAGRRWAERALAHMSVGRSAAASQVRPGGPSGRVDLGRVLQENRAFHAPATNPMKPRPGELETDSFNHDLAEFAIEENDGNRALMFTKSRIGRFEDPKTGVVIELTIAKADYSHQRGNHLRLMYGIRDPDGNRIGKVKRFIRVDGDEVVADHDHFEIEDINLQGQGIATRFNGFLEDFYRANGVDKITLTANLDVGGYAWARAGYDFEGLTAASVVLERFRDILSPTTMMQDLNDEVRDQIRGLLVRADAGDLPTPLEFAMVGWKPGAQMWPGKHLMLGLVWGGVKDLRG